MSGSDLAALNPAQREAVTHGEGPLLVLAGAGTGKTRVITARVCHLIRGGAPPESILAVTFTNKAAGEMRERLSAMLGRDTARRLAISTFHAFCARLLRADIDRLGYKPNFTICDESDQIGLLRKIVTRTLAKDEKTDVWALKARISAAKNRGLSPSPEDGEDPFAAVFARYDRELRALNAVDFDDLLNLAVRLLEKHPGALARARARARHILVDEFQDTNSRQLDLLRLLCPPPHNICAVGDDDQSIYGWRGAEISNILEFERHFPSPKIVRLEQNYRSTAAVLRAANSLIAHNPRRRPKKLWSGLGQGEPVRLVTCADEKEEARFVADRILARRRDGARWEDFAVLFRMNQQARPFEEEFRRQRIPYRIMGASSFYDKREVRDLLAWLRCAQNPHDDISLLRALTAPPRGIGQAAIERAIAESAATSRSVFSVFEDMAFRATLGARAAAAAAEFAAFLGSWSARLAGAPPPHHPLVAELLDAVGFDDYLGRSSATKEEADGRRESVSLLLAPMRERGLSLAEFLDETSLDREGPPAKDEPAGFGVSLITLHAAKGLEFPDVFLAGLEEGLLPHSKSREEGRLDEERRLFYVGITRAMRRLTISHCLARARYGRPSPRNPSSFLAQLDRSSMETVSARQILSAPMSGETLRERFRELKAALAAGSPAGPGAAPR